MLTPEYLETITEACEELASLIHNEVIKRIIKRMMSRLEDDTFTLSQTDKWNLQTAMEAGKLTEELAVELATMTGTLLKEVKKAFKKASVESMGFTTELFKRVGIPVKTKQSPFIIRIMQRNYEKTGGTIKNFTGTYADKVQQTFINACDKAYMLAQSGVVSPSQAIAEAIEETARDGVVINYTHRDGSVHRDTVETATRRAVRTGIGQTTGDIEMSRMEEMDWDIILVSSHLGARYGDGGENPSNHFWWQGKFYSRTGKTKGLPDFYKSTGYGTGEGLCGWNCRHSFGAGDGVFNPYKEYDSEENKRIYDLSQKQRARERAIRTQKRTVIGLKTALSSARNEMDRMTLREHLQTAQAKLVRMNDAYFQFCADNNLRPLDDRLQTAGFTAKDYQEAKKSV